MNKNIIMSKNNKNDLKQQYQKKTDIEHILDVPDTYIGKAEEDEKTGFILKDSDSNEIEHTTFNWIPGLYKCFDEGIVNAKDHFTRMQEANKKKGKGSKKINLVKNIDISVDPETGVITMRNDGNGIDIAKHPEHKLWIPEMIFGHLRTSTNYDKNEKKIVGGKNGFGFKLVLIYSKWGILETIDSSRGLKYTQKFENNLSKINKPNVRKSKSSDYTMVKWLPDYERFGITDLKSDIFTNMFKLFKKRTYDIGAVTDKSVKVTFNKKVVPYKNFESYIDLFIGPKSETKRIYECSNERWEYAVCISPLDEFAQISFVNGISTTNGGKHVDYILNQIVKKLTEYIKKKKKVLVKPTTIKEQLMLFVNCVVENPSFDSQTKDNMNTQPSKFGSKCSLSDKFIDKIAKMGVMDAAISLTEVKDNKAAKKNDGKKTSTIRGIPKLMDANYAGTSRSDQCILILCEGDSAKAGIISGLTKEDRNTIGVFPLKGKLLNVKDVNINKFNNNDEITNIRKILGLAMDKTYSSFKEAQKLLRYGKVLFLTDQDLDGSHIKGLGINMFQSKWHDLFTFEGFIGFMNTPIIKAKRGKQVKSFYNLSDYEKWKDAHNGGKGWSIKYFKGLGTSTSKEFKEYFANKMIVSLKYNGAESDNAIDKVFNKTRADDRKDWLETYNKDSVLDAKKSTCSYEDFIDREMIHFSKYDCERSIPNMIDGFKTSTRKILFSAFKRNLTKEIKVAQFSGYVSEHSGYHHGEMSLNKAIVGLAQDYMGSNNINMLMPNGQFGTRLEGGKDHASERYIFTQLNNLTRTIFPDADDKILNYLDDDGSNIEPDYYLPIVPMILVNGGKGIGTGFSYEGMSYKLTEIINYLQHKLSNKPKDIEAMTKIKFKPYYEGFRGTVIKVSDQKYLFKGCFKVLSSNSIQITELPVGTWTSNYKEFLESLMEDKVVKSKGKKIVKSKAIIKSYKDMCTESTIDFTIRFQGSNLTDLISKKYDDNINMLEKTLKLTTTKTSSNMHLFTKDQKLKKYITPMEIIDDYYPVRYDGYVRRKDYQIKALERELVLLSNKAKFIKEQCDNVIDLRRKKKQVVIDLLKTRGYDVVDGDEEYKYLVKMPIDSVIEENVEKLMKEKGEKEKQLEKLKKITIESMWSKELNKLTIAYQKYKVARVKKHESLPTKKTKKSKKSK